MINSMTGYGSAQGQSAGITYSVEIKTVNNRYFKVSMRLPDAVSFLEADIEKLLRKEVSRGTINYVLRFKNVPANVLFDIDETALQAVVERLGRIASSAGVTCPIEIGSVLNLPGILAPVTPDQEKVEQIREAVLGITRQAMDQVKEMRAAEGAALAADLNKHCEVMKQQLERIGVRSAVVLAEYHEKLKKRVNELLAEAKLGMNEETLAREVAIFAEKSDISEEIARLQSHLQQFTESCRADGQAGRRLDFIDQEMLREANTIASKASDTEIARSVVDIKCCIDRIKEQVQNVE